jgi:hypothetical protein
MNTHKAIVRQHLEKISGVDRTWIEFESDSSQGMLIKVLVVQVNFDTDPNNIHFRQNVIDAVEQTAKEVLSEGTMAISKLRIIPRP